MEIWLMLIALGLLVFGIGYAYRIAVRPFPAHLTWLSVVVGDGATDVGMMLALWVLTHNPVVCLVPPAAHLLTGGPMILGQVLKARWQNDGARAIEEALNGDQA